MSIQTILTDPHNPILLVSPGGNTQIVVGVPHHAPLGVTALPNPHHPVSDENAGFIGWHLSQLLGCPSVIACNYFLDPNKSLRTDYSKAIINFTPRMLVEMHGHSTNHARFDIEISCGSSANNPLSMDIARRLENRLSAIPSLQAFTLSGDFHRIYYKATNSATITADQWKAVHVELPYPIRRSKSRYELFNTALAEILRELNNDSVEA